jgi:hypothetical protein
MEISIINRRVFPILALSLLVLPAWGCDDDPAAPADEFALTHVVPAGDAADVDPNGPVSVTFSHAVSPGMEMYVTLHEGDVSGPEVPGQWSWSDDRMTLTFAPDEPLKSLTLYTLHIGGGIQDATGRTCDLDGAAQQFGGHWATEGMMAGGMMGGARRNMTGPGWQHPNGSFGMLFTFTTA